MEKKCKNCDYNDRLDCHRYPPVAIVRPDQPILFVFPPIAANDWCGEHKTHKGFKAGD
jgi:hypothetical protein